MGVVRRKESDVEGIVLQLSVSGQCKGSIRSKFSWKNFTCLPIIPIQAMEGVVMVVGSGKSRLQRQRYFARKRYLYSRYG